MTDLLPKYQFYYGMIRRLLLFSGLWPYANPSVRYRLLLVAHVISVVIMICALLNFCFHHLSNLRLFFKGLGLTFSFMTIFQKTIFLIIYRKRLIDLHTSLTETFATDFKDPNMREILLSPLVTFYKPSMMVGIFTYAVIVMYWITPLVIIAIQKSKGAEVIKYLLPFPAIFPWTIRGESWLYPAHYVFEVYTGVCLGSFCISIDTLFGYYIFLISGQLRALSHRLTTVKSTENYEQVVRDCVARHQILIRCQKHVECIYGPMVLWMLVTNAIVMCAFIYQVSHMSSIGPVIVIVLYIIMKSLQILFYGFFGSYLGTENDNFREAIYAADWAGSGEKCFMTDILIMVTYTPELLRACSLSTISVDMFVAVSNTALSYFFMLRALEEGNEA